MTVDRFPEIFVLRHGQTEWNLAGKYQGRLDSPLTATGREQASNQSVILSDLLETRNDFDAFCSPQGRAHSTAMIALGPLGQQASADDRLKEIYFGDWQGLTFDEIAESWPEHCKYADQDMFAWNFTAPKGENFDDVYDRSLSFLSQLTRPAVIVTHGITSYVLRGIWLDLGQNEMHALSGGQGCVFRLVDGEQRRFPDN